MGAMPPENAAGPLAVRYDELVASGAIEPDTAQQAIVARLDRLIAELGQRAGFLTRLFRRADAPKGVYIYGEVGRGKTMLMDAFFDLAPVTAKRRVHFNEFMNDVQDRLHGARSGGASDPVQPVAASIADETRLLCLDEFQVTDIADAMILARLFEALFARGLVLVATSNVAPDDLYKNGLNRPLFTPFIAILDASVDTLQLDAPTDYRLKKLSGTPVYITPLSRAATEQLDRVWTKLTGTARGQATSLRTRGRDIAIPQASDGVARFSFADLCEAPLAAHDYVQIARAFHTIIVDGIPVLTAENRSVARRFILLVDTLYDHHTNLICSAATEPDGIYVAPAGEEAFAFRRTVSRLIEMRSEQYLAAAHGAAIPE